MKRTIFALAIAALGLSTAAQAATVDTTNIDVALNCNQCGPNSESGFYANVSFTLENLRWDSIGTVDTPKYASAYDTFYVTSSNNAFLGITGPGLLDRITFYSTSDVPSALPNLYKVVIYTHEFLGNDAYLEHTTIREIGAAAWSVSNAGNVIDAGSFKRAAAPVPEPESYAMFLAGLGLLGFVARRKAVSQN